MKKTTEGFSKLNREKRLHRLQEMNLLTQEDLLMLKSESGLTPDVAEQFVENTIGCYQLPLGVAVNFNIDNQDYVIPMVIEETSVIAASSKNAKWIRDQGSITTKNLSRCIIGQIQIPIVNDFDKLSEKIIENKSMLIEEANKTTVKTLVARGGGVRDIKVRKVSRGDGQYMAIIHIMLDVCDAMGANMINQVCEYLKPLIELVTGESAAICILSNLSDTKITQAIVRIKDVEPELGKGIAEASLFAECDPYRAATSNKGVMNGMDAVLIATGNDWRAVEAGVHSYAAHTGRYRSITSWKMEEKDLVGTLEAPILVGIVGGVTRLHPLAKMCLRIMNIKSADQLARVVAAVGLVQNLAAIRTLSTEGIIKGHMKLHLVNLALAVGATEDEIPTLKQALIEHLEHHKYITQADALSILTKMRSQT